MQCLMTRSMLVCMGLSLSSCATASLPIDDFCQIYTSTEMRHTVVFGVVGLWKKH
jgi:hypothetical protein